MAEELKIKLVIIGAVKTGKTPFCKYLGSGYNILNFEEYIETPGAAYFEKKFYIIIKNISLKFGILVEQKDIIN